MISNKEFRDKITRTAEEIYEDIKNIEKFSGITLSDAERREEVAKILTACFNANDDEYDWEVTVIYDSMSDIWETHKI